MWWLEGCVFAAATLWLLTLLAPWRPWSTRERLERSDDPTDIELTDIDLSDVTVLIPARNEASVIGRTLNALRAQGRGLKVVIVDDQSTDDTADVVARVGGGDVTLVRGSPIRPGWTGKLWAQEQGRAYLERPLTLLLDADIELAPGLIRTLRSKLVAEQKGLVSLMAELPMETFWEQFLLPAYVFFFKLLYPFRLSNAAFPHVAAAAGGCILLQTKVLTELGGFGALRGALIDDCALARLVKSRGYRLWLGLTRSAKSVRAYGGPRAIWNTVARTAFTQLQYSIGWLLACTAVMAVAFLGPVAGLAAGSFTVKGVAGGAWLVMAGIYYPTLRFYGVRGIYAVALPLIGIVYLGMTWGSAVRFWRGERSRWKGRVYLKGG